MWNNQTTFDDEFRRNAAGLYFNSDRSLAEVAAGLGICAAAATPDDTGARNGVFGHAMG